MKIRKINKNNRKAQLKIQAGKNQRFLVPQSSKSQLKIQEMAFMLMAVVLFFILALLFFISVKYRQMYREASLLEQEKTLSTVSKLSDTAEFTCTGSRPLCVDTDKLLVMKDREAYDGFWGKSIVSISVVRIFPSENQTLIECDKNNYPRCNTYKIYEKQTQTGNIETISTYVSLCRKEMQNNYLYEKCELGVLLAGFEPRQAGEGK